MTAEQMKAKESAEKFMIYLYKKYYPQIEAEMKRREEMPEGISFYFLVKLGLSFISNLRYNKRK